MAIVFSYPTINSQDLQSSDRFIISQMNINGNPTKSVTLGELASYFRPSPYVPPIDLVTGTGTTNRLTKWKAPVGSSEIEDSGIEDTGSAINVPYRLNINNAITPNDGIGFINPSGLASGVVNMYYNGTGQGARFIISRGSTGGAEIELEADGDVNINRTGNGNFFVGGEVTLDDYGSGSITGTATYNLEVDASGKIIETTTGGGGSSPFDSTNSAITPAIKIGATASPTSTSVDGIFIGSDLINSNNDEQINIGHNNDGTGTQNTIIGANNTQTGNGAYTVLLGTFNTATSNTSVAIGRQNDMSTGDTMTLGQNNQSSFTGGVSNAGLMNVSVGAQNQLDCDKAAVLGFANDITGSFGWTLGSGKEAVVVGSRMTMSLLGPNRSGTNRY